MNALQYVIRAAQEFIDHYGEAGAVRMLSVVTFADTAQVIVDWTDVSDPGNAAAVKAMIEDPETSNQTFMQGGLLLARNLMQQPAIELIEKRAVILLSDGLPNRYIESDQLTLDPIDSGIIFQAHDSVPPPPCEFRLGRRESH